MDDRPYTIAEARRRYGSWINIVKAKDAPLAIKLCTILQQFGEDTPRGYDEALFEVVMAAYMMGLSYHYKNHARIVHDLSEMVNRVATRFQERDK